MKSGIYRILNTINGKQYIGSSSNLIKRKSAHFRNLRLETHVNEHLQNAFDKYGKQAFVFEILLECSEENLITEEQRFIDNTVLQNGWENLYNICPRADRTKVAEETKIKIAIANSGENNPMFGKTGENNPNFGKPMSEETRQKMKENHADVSGENNPNFGNHALAGENNPMFGRTQSEETREKIRQKAIGRKLSEKTKKKIAIANSGENNPMFGRTGENHSSAKLTNSQAEEIRAMVKNGMKQIDIAKKFDVTRGTINNIVNNKTYKQKS